MACVNHPTVTEGLVHCTRCAREFCPNCLVTLRGQPFCGACKGEVVTDIRSGVGPGELDLATVGRRFAALFVDGLVLSPVSMGLSIFMIVAPEAARRISPAVLMVASYPLIFSVTIVYEALMLKARGQTLGKMALGIRVVTPEGGPLTAGQAWGRASVKTVIAACAALTYYPALFTKERTTLHDMAAKTRVIRVR